MADQRRAGKTPAENGVVDLMAALETSVKEARAARTRRRHDANVSLVAEAMKRWRLQHGAYDVDAAAVAEFVVQVLEQEGRLL